MEILLKQGKISFYNRKQINLSKSFCYRLRCWCPRDEWSDGVKETWSVGGHGAAVMWCYGCGWDLMTTGGLYRAVRGESYSFKSLRPRRRIFTECLLSVIKRSQLYFYCPNLVKRFSGVKTEKQQRLNGCGGPCGGNGGTVGVQLGQWG